MREPEPERSAEAKRVAGPGRGMEPEWVAKPGRVLEPEPERAAGPG